MYVCKVGTKHQAHSISLSRPQFFTSNRSSLTKHQAHVLHLSDQAAVGTKHQAHSISLTRPQFFMSNRSSLTNQLPACFIHAVWKKWAVDIQKLRLLLNVCYIIRHWGRLNRFIDVVVYGAQKRTSTLAPPLSAVPVVNNVRYNNSIITIDSFFFRLPVPEFFSRKSYIYNILVALEFTKSGFETI